MPKRQPVSGLQEIDHVPDPVWLNFSYMVRESVTSSVVKTGMERSQHLTSTVYFGIVAIEAFLNEQMRLFMVGENEEVIVDKLRAPKIRLKDKIRKWPSEILGRSLDLNTSTINLIIEFQTTRNDLTHPKRHGHYAYSRLGNIDPMGVVNSVAEYIVRFHEEKKSEYPYWIFGWNYLNPRPDSCGIFVLNSDSFCWSLQGLGFRVPIMDQRWREEHLGTHEGYLVLKRTLDSVERCEPKAGLFPFKPILCRRWWMPDHQNSCGRVSQAAIDFARRREG